MSTPNEETLVENAAIDQLRKLGWAHLRGDKWKPALTERESFREVFLYGRLRAALRRINLDDDGHEWLDDARLTQAINALERLSAHGLVEANETVTNLLLTGVPVEGHPQRGAGRDQIVRFIDFRHPERNDFLVVNQFRVDLPGSGGREFILPDLLLFVNGLPLVVAECKSPSAVNPLERAFSDLLSYMNQRGAAKVEGVERLFYTNQVIAGLARYQAGAGTITSDYEQFLEWKDTTPQPLAAAAQELGVSQLTAQHMLIQGMLRPANLLDLVEHFTLFKENEHGQRVKLMGHYQQFRAVQKALHRLKHGQTRQQHGEFDERGGVVWHTQGSGKSLTMVFLIRKMRSDPDLRRFKVVVVTDRTDLEKQLRSTAALTGETIHRARKIEKLKEHLRNDSSDLVFGMIQKYQDDAPVGGMPAQAALEDDADISFGDQLFPVLNESERILVLVDEAHRSHTNTLHANLLRALPNCARIGFTGTPIIASRAKKRTHEIFGDYIDKYTLKESEADGSTVRILYEGKTALGEVKNRGSLDQLFEDMFQERPPEELEAIKRKYATTGNVLEAPNLIAAKADDMLRHYVANVLPNGFKAQVVATSRLAAARYHAAFLKAYQVLLAQLEALDPALLALDESARESLPAEARFLLAAHGHLDILRRLEFAVVMSGGSRKDPLAAEVPQLDEFTDERHHDAAIARFKKPLQHADPAKRDGLAVLIVKSMLLTGFDAPVEQVIYLDRNMRDAELLQAIARVNRTHPGKGCGYVVDYFGVTQHLTEALAIYTQEDVQGAQTSLRDELPRLEECHRRVLALFHERGIPDIADIDAYVFALRDPRLRADFVARLGEFLESMDIVLPRPEALPYLRDMKLLGFIHKSAVNRYRDEGMNLLGVGAKVRQLIDEHIVARGVNPKIAPISILDADFEKFVDAHPSTRARAQEMEHAARYHIQQHFNEDPARYRKLSQRLDEILAAFAENWETLAEELKQYVHDFQAGRKPREDGLDPQTQAPFYDVLAETVVPGGTVDPARLRAATVEIVEHIRENIRLVDFWQDFHKQDILRQWLLDYFDYTQQLPLPFEKLENLVGQVMELAQARHQLLVAD